ncbi:MAG TPA: hypothetical protein VF331_22875 [Polyangiales bacterium]
MPMIRATHGWRLILCLAVLSGACTKTGADSVVSDAGNDRASAHDAAAADAGRESDATVGTQCTLTHGLQFGGAGGNVAVKAAVTLTAAGVLTVTNTPVTADARLVPWTCTPALPACGLPSAVDISDIARDLANADVIAAFVTGLAYGSEFPDSGSFGVSRDDGHGFSVAPGECPTIRGSCNPTPAGVQQLVDDLSALELPTLSDPACAPPHAAIDGGSGDAGASDGG